MATCPDCGRFLDDGHVCRGGRTRRIKRALTVVLGASAGLLIGFNIENNTLMVAILVGVLGAVLASALWQSL